MSHSKKINFPKRIVTDIAPATMATMNIAKMRYNALWLEAEHNKSDKTYNLYAFGSNHFDEIKNAVSGNILSPWDRNQKDVSQIKLFSKELLEENISLADTFYIMSEFHVCRCEALNPEINNNNENGELDIRHPARNNIKIETLSDNFYKQGIELEPVSSSILRKYSLETLGRKIIDTLKKDKLNP